eukprot:9503839-Pyramimonas_sp.AAC.4
MSSTCLAVRRFGLVSEFSSCEVGVGPWPLALAPDLKGKALRASLVPTTGFQRCRQRMVPSRAAKPGSARSADAEPGGGAKQTMCSSPVASASPR